MNTWLVTDEGRLIRAEGIDALQAVPGAGSWELYALSGARADLLTHAADPEDALFALAERAADIWSESPSLRITPGACRSSTVGRQGRCRSGDAGTVTAPVDGQDVPYGGWCGGCDRPVLRCRCSAESACPAREDATHCDCWWDGDPCCSCGADSYQVAGREGNDAEAP